MQKQYKSDKASTVYKFSLLLCQTWPSLFEAFPRSKSSMYLLNICRTVNWNQVIKVIWTHADYTDTA